MGVPAIAAAGKGGGQFAQMLQAQGANALGYATGGILSHGLGLIFARSQDKRQLEQQSKLNQLQEDGTNRLNDRAMERQKEMWEYTGYGGQKRQMKEAGLNPALMYGMSGGGGQTVGNGGGGGSPMGAAAPAGGGEMLGLMNMYLQNQMTAAQIEKTKAETKNIDQGTNESLSREELNVLEKVIKDYTGREAKDFYENVSSPNRGIQAKTWQDELEARQGIAGTIYELWKDGKLAEKGIAEIEALALGNAKTDAETKRIEADKKLIESKLKGQDLSNAITELEKTMQEKFGIDRSAPTFLKMVARLLTEFFIK